MAPIRVCRGCNRAKVLDEFYKGPHYTSGIAPRCRTCLVKAASSSRKKNRKDPDKLKKRQELLARYGLTIETYDQMVQEQGGTCKICGLVPERQLLVVDHAHDTGKVRGLLCSQCNSGLGLFRDNTQVLGRAIQYLIDNEGALSSLESNI